MLYKCIIRHRSGFQNDCVYAKVLYIESDTTYAAFIKASEMTKSINNVVYKPEIYECIIPEPDYTVTSEEITIEYGTIAMKEAIEKLKYTTIHKIKP